ncbi:MAG: CPBP family intramembrane glutamic endopeptidase [Asticcacaulis sp.]
MTQPAQTPPLMIFADKGRHTWWRYLVGIILAFLIQIVITVAAMVPFLASGMKPAFLQSAISNPAQPVPFFTAVGVEFAALLTGFALAGLWLHKKPPSDYLGRWRWSLFTLGVLIWLAVMALNLAVDYALAPKGFSLGSRLPDAATIAAVGLGLGVQTFAEEFIFRGYFTQGLLKWLKRPWLTAVISGAIFGACHIPNGSFQALSATLLGVALAWIAIRTGSLAFGYGLHLVNNVFGALVVVSAGDVFKGAPGLIVQDTPHLNVADTALVAAALLIIVIAFRLRGDRTA